MMTSVKYFCELTLRVLDRASLPFLYCVLASAVFRVVIGGRINPTETLVAFVFLTFATVGIRAVCETAAAWRDFPYWLDLTEFRKRDSAIATPISLLAATSLGAAIASGTPVWRATSAYLILFVVDRVAARWSRTFVETAARDFRSLIEKNVLTTNASGDDSNQLKNNVLTTTRFIGENWAKQQSENAFENETENDDVLIATQRRTQKPDGSEEIVGEVAIQFEADAEIAALFVAFCPPFEGVPRFEFEPISNGDYNVKATSVQPFGVRLEAKRRANLNVETVDSQRLNANELRVEYFATFPNDDANDRT